MTALTRNIKDFTHCTPQEAEDLTILLTTVFGFDLGKVKASKFRRVARMMYRELSTQFQNN